jgi:serine/threonine protein kinase
MQADIWSLGVIFFQMVFGVMLYDSVSARQRLKEIEEKRYFSPDKELTFNGITVSADANNFLYRALEVSTEKRMGWRELLEHPLIRQKEEEPIGDRFLVQNNLKLPEVNLDI